MNRIYNKNIDIDMKKAQAFFENRFSKENPQASVMLRATPDNIAEKRDENEAKLIRSLIDFNSLDIERRIIDIGCGYGRLAMHFKEQKIIYDGIDSSKTYITAATEIFKDYKNINFHTMLADELDKNILRNDYNTIFLTGLFVYMNDTAVEDVLKSLTNFVQKGALFYIRESISIIGERLTLKDFHSDELQTEYNAIYRTAQEYEEFMATHLPNAKIISSNLLLDKSTGARKETNQQYWLLELN